MQGGKPLIEHDIIAAQLAEMQMQIDAARAYIHHAAWKADHRDTGWDPTLGALPKVFASEVAWKVVTKALELHGGVRLHARPRVREAGSRRCVFRSLGRREPDAAVEGGAVHQEPRRRFHSDPVR